MNTAAIRGGFVGFIMLVVGLALIVPELAIDSHVDCSSASSHVDGNMGTEFFVTCPRTHPRGLARDKGRSIPILRGLSLLGFAVLAYWLEPYFVREFHG